MMSKNLDAALALAKRGFLVFPLHTPTPDAAKKCSCNNADCRSIGKHPRNRDGLKSGTTNEADIRRWWGMWPDANIGVCTGARSGPRGLVVLDIDGPRGEQSMKDSGHDVSDAPQVVTGRGRHVYYAQDGHFLRNFTGRLPGVDLRADGGYVVAPPSLHESGRRYEWLDDLDPASMTEGLPPVPAWIVELAREGSKDADGLARSKLADKREWGEGERNAGLASLGGRLRRAAMDAGEILIALMAANQERCRPPLPEDEVERIAESVARYAPGDLLGHGAPDDELVIQTQAVAQALLGLGVAPKEVEVVAEKAQKAVLDKRAAVRAQRLEIVDIVHKVAVGGAAVFDLVVRYGDRVAAVTGAEAALVLNYRAVAANALESKVALPMTKEAVGMWPEVVGNAVESCATIERAPEEDVVGALIEAARDWLASLEAVEDPAEVQKDPRRRKIVLTEDGANVVCFSGAALQAEWNLQVPDAKRRDRAKAMQFLEIRPRSLRSKSANRVITMRAGGAKCNRELAITEIADYK